MTIVGYHFIFNTIFFLARTNDGWKCWVKHGSLPCILNPKIPGTLYINCAKVLVHVYQGLCWSHGVGAGFLFFSMVFGFGTGNREYRKSFITRYLISGSRRESLGTYNLLIYRPYGFTCKYYAKQSNNHH